MPEVAEVYIDESGSTGMALDDIDQPNLFLVATEIPAVVHDDFWTHAMSAWRLASDVLSVPVESLELKGSELYGGRGRFQGTRGDDRLRVLGVIVDAIVECSIRVYWDGFPKHLLAAALREEGAQITSKELSARALTTFVDDLHTAVSATHVDGLVSVFADQLPTRPSGKGLVCERWAQFTDTAVQFCSSSEAPGLQVADILAHTLARANRTSLPADGVTPSHSHTDLKAVEFHMRLGNSGLWINLSEFLAAGELMTSQ